VSLLQIRDLVYRTGEKEVLSGLSLSVERGEVHGILGINGAGKSTLGYLIMGCDGYRPASGQIRFDDHLLNDLRIHERAKLGISMAWQEPVRFEGISVKEYLSLKNRETDPAFYLEIVGLHPDVFLHRMADRSLSGGERKRIEIASVLALKPRLAILDEPDSGMDLLSMKDMVNVISGFKEIGSSVVLITHREEIVAMADRASQLCNGRIVCSGAPEKVAAYYKSRQCLACDKEACLDV